MKLQSQGARTAFYGSMHAGKISSLRLLLSKFFLIVLSITMAFAMTLAVPLGLGGASYAYADEVVSEDEIGSDSGSTSGASSASSVTRYINVAYDDSGSMDNGTKWCQAHYALEVFANMLGPNDVLKVFTMSAAERGSTKPSLVIKGSEPADERVAKAHSNFSVKQSGTPFQVAVNAYDDLSSQSNDGEKWLVVLTDGAFTSCDGKAKKDGYSLKQIADMVEDDLNEWADEGINIEFLGMGDKAAQYLPESRDGLNAQAINASEILDGIVAECQTIFKMAALTGDSFNAETGDFNIEIPMRRIVVFAQGEGVSVGSVSLDGAELSASDSSSVKYVDKPHKVTKKDWDGSPDKSLQGQVATFTNGDGFESGSGNVQISNAQSVAVYYEPYANVEVTFTDSDGAAQTVGLNDKVSLTEGSYTVGYRLLNPFTGEPINSSLITDVDYSAEFVFDDGTRIKCVEGQSFEATEGSGKLVVDAVVNGSVGISETLAAAVIPKDLQVEILSAPSDLNASSLDSSEPYVLKVTKSGQELSYEQWENTDITVSSSACVPDEGLAGLLGNDKGIDAVVTKGDRVSTYNVQLAAYKNEPAMTISGDVPLKFTARYSTEFGDSTGDVTQDAHIEGVLFFQWLLWWVANHTLLLLFLLLLALLAAFLVMELLKPRLPRIEPKIIMDDGEEHKLKYGGKVEHRIWPPWAPETTSFKVSVKGSSSDALELSERFQLAGSRINLRAVKKQGGSPRFCIDDSTIAMMKKHTETSRFPDPNYSCLKTNCFKQNDSFRFEGNFKHRRKGWVRSVTYKIKFH